MTGWRTTRTGFPASPSHRSDGIRVPGSISRRTCCASGMSGLPWCPSLRTVGVKASVTVSSIRTLRVWRRPCGPRGLRRGIVWPDSCPILSRPSRPCWPPPVSARSGPPVLRTLASTACWTGLVRSNPRCCSALTVTSTTVNPVTPWSVCQRSPTPYPALSAWWWCPCCPNSPSWLTLKAPASGLTLPSQQLATSILRSCPSTNRSTSCTPRARPVCPSALSTAQGARCYSTSRSIACTSIWPGRTCFSISPPVAG